MEIHLTYCKVQSPSWAANWFEASQEIPRISRNPNVHYRTHKRPPPVSILGQLNSVHIPTSHLLQIHPNIIHSSTPRSPHWSLSLRFPQRDPIITYLLSPRCRVLPEQLTGLQLVKKFPAFHGTRRFITALTSVRHENKPTNYNKAYHTPHWTPYMYIKVKFPVFTEQIARRGNSTAQSPSSWWWIY